MFLTPALTASAPLAQGQKELYVKPTIEELIQQYTTQYHVSYTQVKNTLRCESNLNSNAVGDSGHSFGLAQIYLPAHPLITKARALDPEFAINFMASAFATGNQNMWTCWRILYGNDA